MVQFSPICCCFCRSYYIKLAFLSTVCVSAPRFYERRRLRSLLLCSCHVLRVLITSLVGLSYLRIRTLLEVFFFFFFPRPYVLHTKNTKKKHRNFNSHFVVPSNYVSPTSEDIKPHVIIIAITSDGVRRTGWPNGKQKQL